VCEGKGRARVIQRDREYCTRVVRAPNEISSSSSSSSSSSHLPRFCLGSPLFLSFPSLKPYHSLLSAWILFSFLSSSLLLCQLSSNLFILHSFSPMFLVTVFGLLVRRLQSQLRGLPAATSFLYAGQRP